MVFLLLPLCKTSELTNLVCHFQDNFIFVELEKWHWFVHLLLCCYRNNSVSDVQDTGLTKAEEWIGQEKIESSGSITGNDFTAEITGLNVFVWCIWS